MGRNLLVLLFSTLFAFGIAELALRALYPLPGTWLEPQVRYMDSPLLGWVMVPGDRSYTLEAPVAVNSLGLRDDEPATPKPADEWRILALGDSFTFATGVAFEDLWVQRLEAKLRARSPGRGAQVINAGVEGYNSRQELIYLLAEGFELEPDALIVAFYWNDLLGNEPPLPELSTPRTAPGTLPRPPQRHALPRWLRDRLRRSLVLYLGVTRGKQLRGLLQPPEDLYSRSQRALLEGDAEILEPLWEATGRRLGEIAAAAAQRGLPCLLVAFPMENSIRREYPDLVYGERLRRIGQATGMPFVDLERPFRESLQAGANPFLPYDLHPNATGMEIAAQRILTGLVDAGMAGPGGEAP